MIEHVNEWLGAYLDGELRGLQLRQVESHLAECSVCRSELESLRNLSALLRESAPAGSFTPSERFAANLTLRLPPQPELPPSRKVLNAGWWLIPAGILGAWVFTQIVTGMASLVVIVSQAGLLGNLGTWLQARSQPTDWFTTTLYLFSGQMSTNSLTILDALNQAGLFIQDSITQITWQVVLVGLYWVWLASWWLRRRQPAANQETLPIRRVT